MYAATVNGRHLTFDVECVWRRNMVIRDNETETLWQHATGEGLVGPLQGERLTLLGGEMISWSGWKEAHPHSLAALEPEEWTGLVSKERVTAVLEKVTSVATVPGRTRRDERLRAHEMVVGIVVDDEARAYPLIELGRLGRVEEVVNGRQLEIAYDETHDVVRAFVDGTPVTVQRTWWSGWFEFHPQTKIFTSIGLTHGLR